LRRKALEEQQANLNIINLQNRHVFKLENLKEQNVTEFTVEKVKKDVFREETEHKDNNENNDADENELVNEAVQTEEELKITKAEQFTNINNKNTTEEVVVDTKIESKKIPRSIRGKLKKKQKMAVFKSISYIIILYNQIKIANRDNTYRLTSLKEFTYYHCSEKIEEKLSKWVDDAIKTQFISILVSQNMDLDIRASKMDQAITDKCVKLEVNNNKYNL